MVCHSSKIAQKLPPPLTNALPGNCRPVKVSGHTKKIAQCGDVLSEHPLAFWTKLRSCLGCLLRAHCSRIISWNHFLHARCAVTTGIGIGTRYRYRSSSKVSVSVVSVNSGIGLTLPLSTWSMKCQRYSGIDLWQINTDKSPAVARGSRPY